MKRILIACLCALMTLGAQANTDVAGITFDASATVGGQALTLNGAGVRTKLFFDVYAAGLYLVTKTTKAGAALGAEGPKRIDLTMLRDVSAEKFVASLKDGLTANQAPAALAALQPRIDAFCATLLSLKEARKGQRFQMDYLPGTGTQLRVDGTTVGSAIEGADFFTALLGVWIGEHPAQTDLKSALLGQ